MSWLENTGKNTGQTFHDRLRDPVYDFYSSVFIHSFTVDVFAGSYTPFSITTRHTVSNAELF